ncbi:alpha/beta fold hydrolase [Rhodococcus aetherivorans]
MLEGLGVTSAAIVGVSLGGWMAVDYATRRPERVTRLVLLCPGGLGRQRMGWLVKAMFLRLFGRRGHSVRRPSSPAWTLPRRVRSSTRWC